MKPWSCASMACFPPAATAFFTISSTSARLSHESAKSPSVCLVVSQSSCLVNVLKKGSPRSMTKASSLMIMQAALSSVNFGLNSKPSFVKKFIDFFRSRTARLTKSFRERFSAMIPPWVEKSLFTWAPYRKDGAKPLIAQPQPSPEERRDVDRKERMAEERVSDPHVGCDRSAQVA